MVIYLAMERPQIPRRDKTSIITEAEFAKRRIAREQTVARPVGQLALFSETGSRDMFIYPIHIEPRPEPPDIVA